MYRDTKIDPNFGQFSNNQGVAKPRGPPDFNDQLSDLAGLALAPYGIGRLLAFALVPNTAVGTLMQ